MLIQKEINKRIKIMHITLSLDTGGLEKMLLEFARRLDKEKFDLAACCLTQEGDLSEEFKRSCPQVYYCRKKNGLDYGLFLRLAKVLKAAKPDIVHTHDNSTLSYGTIAARLAGVKRVINTEHGGVYFESGRKKAINKILWRMNNTVVCVSHDLKQDLTSMGLLNGRTRVIHNGIDFSRFGLNPDKKTKRGAFGLTESDFVITSVGRLSREKNQRMLLACAPHILAKIKEARFILVGDGPERKNLEEHAAKTGISDKVIFLGRLPDTAEILNISDCFASCSNYESFGLAILEAMASGVPVVATNAGGISEIIKHNVNGVLVDKNDILAFSSGVLKIKSDAEFSLKLIQNAKESSRANFDIDRMIEEYSKLYENTILS